MLRYAFVPAKGTSASFLDTHMDALPCQDVSGLSYGISLEGLHRWEDPGYTHELRIKKGMWF